ncbi:hypothetical protein NUW58_g8173 [Xylaria curta]|uniref:Uncharacterized protein n=1 Tax=Xylaria curta TaxID=42375 RepID=A0ACC1NAW1_9PEZI|nr:hypothetical protein NUW58_g8173 [Xylaria curta]
MAIFSAVPPPPELGGATSNNHSHEYAQLHPQEELHATAAASHQSSIPTNEHGVDIESWTVSALQSLSVSPAARGTGSPLTIPLDEAEVKKERPKVNIYDPL